MPKTTQKKIHILKNKLDTLWSEAVKKRAGNKCEFCGREDYLNSHHIYSRSKLSTRWSVDNGACLCVAHHTFSSKFSAHKTPADFMDFIENKRGSEWLDKLRYEANQVELKPTLENLEEIEIILKGFCQ